ncbi:uncharacterized protein LOC143431008 [Xylocopa sonorina]|uniref:uncharacterized protein LOC143431008 n=1 Tax=Xylocopa sonorina TaxID=1818115 RepID=UPI00403B0FAA
MFKYLGVRVANIVKLAKLRNALKMRCSDDAAVRNVCVRQEDIIKKYAILIGYQWPMEPQIEPPTNRRCKDIKESYDKIGNGWLYYPDLLRPSRYLDVIKLRTNISGITAALRRADSDRNYLFSSRCAVFEEPEVVGNHRKPDLIIKDQNRILVVDVQVRYEDKENVHNVYQEKLRKYKDTAEYIELKLNGLTAQVVPIVIGCRGAVLKCTRELDEPYGE